MARSEPALVLDHARFHFLGVAVLEPDSEGLPEHPQPNRDNLTDRARRLTQPSAERAIPNYCFKILRFFILGFS